MKKKQDTSCDDDRLTELTKSGPMFQGAEARRCSQPTQEGAITQRKAELVPGARSLIQNPRRDVDGNAAAIQSPHACSEPEVTLS